MDDLAPVIKAKLFDRSLSFTLAGGLIGGVVGAGLGYIAGSGGGFLGDSLRPVLALLCGVLGIPAGALMGLGASLIIYSGDLKSGPTRTGGPAADRPKVVLLDEKWTPTMSLGWSF